jgi:hypothetical protein
MQGACCFMAALPWAVVITTGFSKIKMLLQASIVHFLG